MIFLCNYLDGYCSYDCIIVRFVGGLFEKWKRDETYLGIDKPIPLSRENQAQRAISLPLRVFLPLLVIYAVGVLLSTLCLIMEILYYTYRLHQQRPRMQIQRTTKR